MIAWILILAALVLLILFLIQPGRISPQQEKTLRGRCYAHRGLHTQDGTVPENCLAAFDAAAAAGYGVELDVQLSSDGEVVVFHDNTLDRMTGVTGRVDAFTLAELKSMQLGGTDHRIPLFREVLDTMAGRTPMIVELKTGHHNWELCEKTLELLRQYQEQYDGDFCIESFDPAIVGWFRKNAPDIVRGQLADWCKGYPNKLGFVLSRCLCNWMGRPQFIAWGPHPKNLMVRLAEAFGPMKIYWTASDPEQAAALQEEFDGVIFEYYTPAPRY